MHGCAALVFAMTPAKNFPSQRQKPATTGSSWQIKKLM
ncbi:hypothetical protein B6254_1298 [Weissella cibaria]|uniref:Uncharacterized protein n=1 Tax=Weissella cibaria TaxID=137591 RepID=A0A2S1KRT1_9LACO|nr:hypothetical protein B6254_1298 [Weissella cibaria]